jgi:predicted outer membrane repeat protein
LIIEEVSMRSVLFWMTALLAVAALPANATVFTVTTDADSGAGSLREAITTANLSAGPHTINFDADYTINLLSVLPTIAAGTTITIVGNGWDRTIIDGGNAPGGGLGVQAFKVDGSLILDGVGIQNCYSSLFGGAVEVGLSASFQFLNSRAEANTSGFYGGAVYSEGTVDVQQSLITGNLAYQGGGMYVAGSTTVEDTTISSNTATDLGGGGITNALMGLTVRRSLIQGNDAGTSNGGGIQTFRASAATKVENSTLDDNTATDGGAISCHNDGSTSLYSVTVTFNQATTNGGGISCPDASMEGSILHRNAAVMGPEIYGTLESLGYNLIASTSGATITGSTTGNLIGINPQIGPLADNGGKTLTRALAIGSPAVDAGAPACSGLTTDQRGSPRPRDGDASSTAECDIGAYELFPGIFANGFESGNTAGWSSAAP